MTCYYRELLDCVWLIWLLSLWWAVCVALSEFVIGGRATVAVLYTALVWRHVVYGFYRGASLISPPHNLARQLVSWDIIRQSCQASSYVLVSNTVVLHQSASCEELLAATACKAWFNTRCVTASVRSDCLSISYIRTGDYFNHSAGSESDFVICFGELHLCQTLTDTMVLWISACRFLNCFQRRITRWFCLTKTIRLFRAAFRGNYVKQ